MKHPLFNDIVNVESVIFPQKIKGCPSLWHRLNGCVDPELEHTTTDETWRILIVPNSDGTYRENCEVSPPGWVSCEGRAEDTDHSLDTLLDKTTRRSSTCCDRCTPGSTQTGSP